MEAPPQQPHTEQFSRLLEKTQTLAKNFRRLVKENAGLQGKLGAQHTELGELRKRVRELDRQRLDAKKRLQHLINQLPGK